MNTAQTFLRRFFADRNMAGSSGDPLYSYRMTREEFDELRVVLAWELSHDRIGPKGAMAFCLWASEWWRRNYEAGPWKWEPMLTELDALEFDTGGWRYLDLQDLVTRGIKYWGRTIYRMGPARGFLVTLALEGGLPTKLILREEAHLRSYLEAVLEGFKLFGARIPAKDLAERERHHLPRVWRRKAVYELCGELAQKLWELQIELGDTTTPVLDLARKRPDWRDELPLRVSDEMARTLLNGLLEGAVKVARRTRVDIRWNVDLAPVGDGDWDLRGWFKLPRRISMKGFARLFCPGSAASAPRRFVLGVRTEKKAFRALAMGAQTHDENGRHFRLRPVRSVRAFQTTDLIGPRKLLARSRSRTLSADEFPGASGLGDLAWVFTPVESSGGERTTCCLVGQGTVRVSNPWALVAVRRGVVAECRDGDVAKVGPVRGRDRLVYLVRGTATFTDGDGVATTVATRSDQETANVEYHLEGKRKSFGGSAASFFLGGPAVQKRINGEFREWISERNLRWKPDIPGESWGPYTSAAVDRVTIRGQGRLRYVESDEVRHSVAIAVLPEGADVRMIPSSDVRRGEIRLMGFGDIEATVPLGTIPDLRVDVRKEAGDYRLRLRSGGEVPRHVMVAVDWRGEGRAMLRLPFPARRASFVDDRGRPLPEQARLARGSLAGVEAEVLVPESGGSYQIRGYSCSGGPVEGDHGRESFVREIPEVGYGHHVLDLAQVDFEITEQLESSDRPRREVRLRIVDATTVEHFPADISVRIFDLAFASCGDGLLGLDGRLARDDLAELQVEMLPLLEPDREPTPLRRTASAVWQVPTGGMKPGPYLVLGRQGRLQRVRPMPWYMGEPDQGANKDGDATTVADAYALAFRNDQPFGHEPFRRVVSDMATDPRHADWPLVVKYLQLESLPVATFPLLRALVRHPAACAIAVADASSEDFDLLWERMERFPFAWWQIPLNSWEQAYKAYAEHWREVLNKVEDTELAGTMLEHQTDGSIDRVRDQLAGLDRAFGFIKAKAADRILTRKQTKIVTPERLDELRKKFRKHRLTCPALDMPPKDILECPELRSEVRRLVDAHPWSKSLFSAAKHRATFVPARTGRFEDPRRADFADAPALTAVMTVAGVQPPKKLAQQIRHVRADHRGWFDEALRLAQLIAFGEEQAHKIRTALAQSRQSHT